MKIIFVGVHNKPGKIALCSSTVSGKTINQVIALLPPTTMVLKVNLFDVEYMPLPDEAHDLMIDFFVRVDIAPEDVVVLLGGIVQKYLAKELACCTTIKAAHPSLQFAKISRAEYIKQLSEKLNSLVAAEVCDATEAP